MVSLSTASSSSHPRINRSTAGPGSRSTCPMTHSSTWRMSAGSTQVRGDHSVLKKLYTCWCSMKMFTLVMLHSCQQAISDMATLGTVSKRSQFIILMCSEWELNVFCIFAPLDVYFLTQSPLVGNNCCSRTF